MEISKLLPDPLDIIIKLAHTHILLQFLYILDFMKIFSMFWFSKEGRCRERNADPLKINMHQIDKKKRSIYSSIHVVVQSYVLNIIICNKWIKQLFDFIVSPGFQPCSLESNKTTLRVGLFCLLGWPMVWVILMLVSNRWDTSNWSEAAYSVAWVTRPVPLLLVFNKEGLWERCS